MQKQMEKKRKITFNPLDDLRSVRDQIPYCKRSSKEQVLSGLTGRTALYGGTQHCCI